MPCLHPLVQRNRLCKRLSSRWRSRSCCCSHIDGERILCRARPAVSCSVAKGRRLIMSRAEASGVMLANDPDCHDSACHLRWHQYIILRSQPGAPQRLRWRTRADTRIRAVATRAAARKHFRSSLVQCADPLRDCCASGANNAPSARCVSATAPPLTQRSRPQASARSCPCPTRRA